MYGNFLLSHIILMENKSLEARRVKNIVWKDKEVGLVIFWKRNRKIARNGMNQTENVNWLKGN